MGKTNRSKRGESSRTAVKPIVLKHTDAAAYLQVSATQLRRFRLTNRIAGFRYTVGGDWYYAIDDLKAFVSKCRQESAVVSDAADLGITPDELSILTDMLSEGDADEA